MYLVHEAASLVADRPIRRLFNERCVHQAFQIDSARSHRRDYSWRLRGSDDDVLRSLWESVLGDWNKQRVIYIGICDRPLPR
jgi:hypothetical protein